MACLPFSGCPADVRGKRIGWRQALPTVLFRMHMCAAAEQMNDRRTAAVDTVIKFTER
jgi:hypothetical protein